MRYLKKLLKLSIFLCIMAAGVVGALYIEHETPWIEDFQYAVGLKQKQSVKARGITFAGNRIGAQRLQRRRDDSFIATLKTLFGGGHGEMVAAHREALIAEIGEMENFDFSVGEMPSAPEKPKKTNRSGSLGGSFGSN